MMHKLLLSRFLCFAHIGILLPLFFGPTNASSNDWTIPGFRGYPLIAPKRPEDFPLQRSTNIGRVLAWGRNDLGQAFVPKNLTNVVAISTSGDHSGALSDVGEVTLWGANNEGAAVVPTSLPSDIVDIGFGFQNSSYALDSSGKMHAWGYEAHQLTTPSPSLIKVVTMAPQLGITIDGSVFGYGGWGVAAGSTKGSTLAIAMGGVGLALLDSGGVVEWPVPWGAPIRQVPVKALSQVVGIASGWGHRLALLNDGTVVGWGDNDKGQKKRDWIDVNHGEGHGPDRFMRLPNYSDWG